MRNKKILKYVGELALIAGVIEIIMHTDTRIELTTIVAGALLCLRGAWNENH